MDLLLLSRDEVQALLDPDALLTALADGFIALSAGQVQAPTRSELGASGTGHLLVKPAWIKLEAWIGAVRARSSIEY